MCAIMQHTFIRKSCNIAHTLNEYFARLTLALLGLILPVWARFDDVT